MLFYGTNGVIPTSNVALSQYHSIRSIEQRINVSKSP